MFTGLIEKLGTVVEVTRRSGGARVEIACEPWKDGLVTGESVAVSGACLTVCRAEAGRFWCDVLVETLEKTTLGRARAGTRVNLERALRVGDRMGGHFVTGHVDGIGRVRGLKPVGADRALAVACERSIAGELVRKGSVACDGVSLTVVEAEPDGFVAHIIPTTWNGTTLGGLKAGDSVNVESDVIGKYVARHARALSGAAGGPTIEHLERAGFVG